MVLTREYVEIPVDGAAMRTFVAAPRDGGPHPGVVFYSDIFQLTEPTLRWAVRLAGYGFVVAVPEIYHRIEPAGTVLGFDDEGKVRGQADADATPVADFDADIDAALGVAGRALQRLARRGRALHGRAPRVPRRVPPAGPRDRLLVRDRAARRQARRGRRRRLARARRRDRGRAADDLGHARPAHAGGRARADQGRGCGPRPALTWREYEAEHAFGRDVGDRYDPEVTDEAFAETVALFRRDALGGDGEQLLGRPVPHGGVRARPSCSAARTRSTAIERTWPTICVSSGEARPRRASSRGGRR